MLQVSNPFILLKNAPTWSRIVDLALLRYKSNRTSKWALDMINQRCYSKNSLHIIGGRKHKKIEITLRRSWRRTPQGKTLRILSYQIRQTWHEQSQNRYQNSTEFFQLPNLLSELPCLCGGPGSGGGLIGLPSTATVGLRIFGAGLIGSR